MHNDTVTTTLPVRLTEAEVCQRAEEASRKLVEIDELERQKKDLSKQMNEKILIANRELRQLSGAVRSRQELRPVECELRISGVMAELYRLDTGELVESRPATAEARQASLPMGLPKQVYPRKAKSEAAS